TGDTNPYLILYSPGDVKRFRLNDAPTGWNIVPDYTRGGDGLGDVFIPTEPSGIFYADIYYEARDFYIPSRTAVTLTLHPPLVAGVPSANQAICTGGDPAVLDGGTSSGGTGAYTYQWESSLAAAGPYTAIGGATSATYDPP